MQFLLFILVGAIAGWLAGYILHRDTTFSIMDVLVGMVGALLGGFLATNLGFGDTTSGLLAQVLIATVGAIIVTFIVGLLQNNKW